MRMPDHPPSKVLITGGHGVGGVASFAEALRRGFSEHGIESEIIPPGKIFRHMRELRDPGILKILSTTAVFAAPLARRGICMAHGVPRADYSGLTKVAGIITSFRIANRVGAQLVSVSHYTASTLQAVFNVRTDGVIHNPLKPVFLEPYRYDPSGRFLITYAGRLIAVKNLHRLIPAMKDLLDEMPRLRVCIVGEGELRPELERMVAGDCRFEFKGSPDDITLRDYLRRTRVFVSGNEVEGFGITYLEAMTQGCVVAMPAGGGGIEISPQRIGRGIQLLPLSWDRTKLLTAFREALHQDCSPIDTEKFSTGTVAGFYLDVDARFSSQGRFVPLAKSQAQ